MGIGSIVRSLEILSTRPQLQEHLCQELADAFEEVMFLLRDRAQKRVELANLLALVGPSESLDALGDEEESAI